MFNKLKSLFIDDDIKNATVVLDAQVKEAHERITQLEKQLADYDAILYEHHKTIASIAAIQTNLLSEMDRAIKNASLKKNRTLAYTTSSKDDDFIN